MVAITSEIAGSASGRPGLAAASLVRRLYRGLLRLQAAAAFDCIEQRLREDAGLDRRSYLAAIERHR